MHSPITPLGNRFCFLHSGTKKSIAANRQLIKTYGQEQIENCDIGVALGGDGFLLSVLGMPALKGKAVFGMNRGTVGFLLNSYRLNDLPNRLDNAISVTIHRLKGKVTTQANEHIDVAAFNDIALFRSSGQSAHIGISVNGVKRIDKLVCDGVLVATPAGSTAYNLSAHGPILPLRSNLLAMTPISSFRPRHWPGALIDNTSRVRFDVLDPEGRGVMLTADSREIHHVTSVDIECDKRFSRKILFESGSTLGERILREQFAV
jgi:NAD+ kinase